MSDCLHCGRQEAEYPFRVLEVQTLHIRDLTGEKRVQALGLFQDYGICRACAQARLDQVHRPGKVLVRKLLPFLIALLLGIAITAACWRGAAALRMMGAAGILCGILGCVSSVQATFAARREYTALSDEEALERAAWECLLASAPKKDGENDLTYIPINEKTLAMKNGDLMIVYKLLPAVAKKAWTLIHGAAEEKIP